jgi:hypothetical protein
MGARPLACAVDHQLLGNQLKGRALDRLASQVNKVPRLE